MVLKPDQQRIKDLLSETITLLCRSGLHFKSEFSVEALIGITLDQEDVFLVSIKETVHTDEMRKRSDSWADDHSTSTNSLRAQSASARHHGGKEHGVGIADLRTKRLDERLLLNQECTKNLSSFVNSSCQKLMPEPMRHVNHKRLRKDPAPKSYAQGEALSVEVDGDELIIVEQKSKRQRLGGSVESAPVTNRESCSEYPNGEAECSNKPCSSVKSFLEINSGIDDITGAIVPESEGSSLQNAEGESRAAECNGANVLSESDAEKVCDVTHTGSESEECFEKEFLKIKDEPNDESWSVSRQQMRHLYGQLTSSRAQSGRKYVSRGSTVGIMHPLAVQQVEPGICSLWQASATQESTTGVGSSLSQWMSSGLVDPSNSEMEVQLTKKQDEQEEEDDEEENADPCLSLEELTIARTVLSMRGNFISLGCLKANRQSLRKTSREQLVAILEKVSTPRNPQYFIGELSDLGVSRIFFKCPPSLVAIQAFSYYQFDPLLYNDLYHAPVTVDKNIKDPAYWIQRIQEKSPFN